MNTFKGINLILLIILTVQLSSCYLYKIEGKWKETTYKVEKIKITKQEIIFDDDSKNVNPIKFTYTVENDLGKIKFIKIQIYNDTVFIREIAHKIEFIKKNEISLKNMEDSLVKTNFYKRRW